MPSLSGGIGDDFRCKFWPSTHNTFQVATETISESLMQQHWQQAMPQDATEAEKDPWHDLFRNRNPWKCHGIWAIDGNWMQFINLGDTRLGQRVQDMSAVHPCLRTMTMTTNGGNLFQTSTMNIHTSNANHIYIRRPRQTQGGARQGIIHLTLFLNGRSRSSRTKKELKSSFSMGFRSYIRHFWGAIFSKLFCLSLPWGFAAGSGSLLAVAASHQQQQQQSSRIAG